MTTLSIAHTDLFFCMRSQQNETGDDGDFWKWATQSAFFNTTQYNALVNQYLGWESEADNSLLRGTTPGSTTFPIGSLPNRPRPVEK